MGGGPHSKSEHMLVTLPFPAVASIIDSIKKNHPQIKITWININEEEPFKVEHGLPDDIWHDITILVTLQALPPSPKECPNLELIHVLSAGTNHISTHPIYTSTSIPLTTSSGIHGPQISEWVLLTALVHSHAYNTLHKWQQRHVWGGSAQSSRLRSIRDNVGQRIGVLGYGSIGRQVGRVSKAMGMDVIAYTASPRHTAESKKDKGYIVPGTGDPDGEFPSAWYSGLDKNALHNFLAQDIDHLLISVPLTKETRHFIGKEELAILGRRSAFVSNISRGQIIDQAALIAALEKGADKGVNTSDTNELIDENKFAKDNEDKGLRGAALDVTDPEPLPEDDPLWDVPNVIITPHISGAGVAYVQRAFEVLEVNLKRRENGEKLINVVDRKRGY